MAREAQLQPQIGESVRPKDPNVLQRAAANPAHSVWVAASAGSGKTKVLTDRVLRLLLPQNDGTPGAHPGKILCLTFTKAAASEMSLRIHEKLADWAIMEDGDLAETLTKLLGRAPENAEIEGARQLFARIMDTDSGLKIMTIHSFCQSVLARFPLEAGLNPSFQVMDESDARALLAASKNHIVTQALEEKGSPRTRALHTLASEQNENQFQGLLQALMSERGQLAKLLKDYKDADGLYTALCSFFAIRTGQSEEDFLQSTCVDETENQEALRKIAALMLTDVGKEGAKNGRIIADWLADDHAARIESFKNYQSAFLTKDGGIKKRLAVKKIYEAIPEAEEILLQEAARLQSANETLLKIKCAEITRDLFVLGSDIEQDYKTRKDSLGLLDYDDLILRTRDLLKGAADWVLYKLDQGIDHILIDEAQDTNPEQWDIIEAICDEFYAHDKSADQPHRTLFTVGDQKQSIFSFQRAAPEEFESRKTFFKEKFTGGGHEWNDVPMNISFRSAQAILACVDRVFEPEDMQRALGEQDITHSSFRRKQGGQVTLWPAISPPQTEEDFNPWDPPIKPQEISSAGALCADHLAQNIAAWLADKRIIPSRGRAVSPGDIMILVRTRSAIVGHITRALKKYNIPVSGADRMVLRNELAVTDLLSTAGAALLPEDDLTLACLLKSPLIGMDENDLFALAWNRRGSLWNALRTRNDMGEISAYIRELKSWAEQKNPYEFFQAALSHHCPAMKNGSGLQAMIKRLGPDCIDPLEEFLSRCIQFEQNHAGALQEFLHVFERDESQIKREMEESGEAVRIMTAHSAKGLQAPIVILPDTISKPDGTKTDRLLWPQKTELALPLFCPRSDIAPQAYKDALATIRTKEDCEYRRLLYVAMTRAEDELYVTGFLGKKGSTEGSWYDFVRTGLKAMDPVFEDVETDTLIYSEPQTGDPDRTPKTDDSDVTPTTDKYDIPDWLFREAPAEPTPPSPLIPSRPSHEEEEPTTLSPLQKDNQSRFRRGNITHKLLEFLPDIPADRRAQTAQIFLKRYAGDLEEEILRSILEETLQILKHPQTAPFFAEGSMAEVPISGLLPDGRLISGQIDRLWVGDGSVWIVDYKTNRPAPKDPDQIPRVYKKQMQAYKETLQQIYPDHAIHCALLWTDGPFVSVLA